MELSVFIPQSFLLEFLITTLIYPFSLQLSAPLHAVPIWVRHINLSDNLHICVLKSSPISSSPWLFYRHFSFSVKSLIVLPVHTLSWLPALLLMKSWLLPLCAAPTTFIQTSFITFPHILLCVFSFSFPTEPFLSAQPAHVLRSWTLKPTARPHLLPLLWLLPAWSHLTRHPRMAAWLFSCLTFFTFPIYSSHCWLINLFNILMSFYSQKPLMAPQCLLIKFKLLSFALCQAFPMTWLAASLLSFLSFYSPLYSPPWVHTTLSAVVPCVCPVLPNLLVLTHTILQPGLLSPFQVCLLLLSPATQIPR